jgi:hypothetical protein
MSIIFGIMKEEYDRLREAEGVYRKSVENAVQGAPRIKHIGNKDYLYLERRDGSKVVDEYIGPAESKKAIEILNVVKRRRKDQESLKKVLHDLKDVKRVLRGKI